VKFGMVAHHKRIYKYCMKYFCALKVKKYADGRKIWVHDWIFSCTEKKQK